MARLHYVIRELFYRRGRSLAMAGSILFAVMAAVLLVTLASSYTAAIRQPMKTVGADMIVQLSGDIPKELKGLVFPHPNAMLPKDVVEGVRKLTGVLGVTQAVYLWDLQPNHYQSVLGVEDDEVGLGALNGMLTIGGRLAADNRGGVLADSDFAAIHGLKPGGLVTIGEKQFIVVGIVDSVRSAKVFRADLYAPLKTAQALAADAPQVKALYPFKLDDINLLLVKVDRSSLEAVVKTTQSLLGKKAVVSSELSFRETLESALFLSERHGVILALVISAFTAAFVLRATATAINERRREMAILQAVGWSWSSVRRQVLIENTALAFVGCVCGVLFAAIAIWGIGGVQVTMDLPWDLSSTPHFIPEANVDRRQTVSVPLALAWETLVMASAGGLIIGLATAVAALAARDRRPWALLRSE